jgi:hypothetical protein
MRLTPVSRTRTLCAAQSVRNVSHRVDSSPTRSESQRATGRNRWQTLRPEGVRPPAVDTAGAPRDA